MTVTPRPADELPAQGLQRSARSRPSAATGVIVGVDGTAGSHAAMRWAAAEACRRAAALRIVSAWQQADPGRASAVTSAAAASRVQDALDGLLLEHGRPQSVGCVTPRGEPGEVLVQQAKGAALLVLGTSPGAGPGSTARYCLRNAPCPVVFVPAPPAPGASVLAPGRAPILDRS